MCDLRRSLVLVGALALAAAGPAAANSPQYVFQQTVSGYDLNAGHGIVVDAAGNSYVIGYDYQDGVHLDIVVVKLDPAGAVLWTQYVLGDQHDWASDITLDGKGDVLVTGWTDSGDFPIVGGFDSELTGFREAFLMKLSSSDGSILYSTFLGGDYTDEGHGIALDAAGDIWLVGSTGSTDFPTTPDAWQGWPSAPLYIYDDAFLTELSPAGDAILYSTYSSWRSSPPTAGRSASAPTWAEARPTIWAG